MINTTLPLLLIVAAIIAGSNYRVIWYHTEFWIKDTAKRRPYTYILRDFYHEQPLVACFLLAWAGYALGRWIMPIDHILLFCGGLLMGHLFWGGEYKPGQQETPDYDPDNDTIELTDKGRAANDSQP
jgi:hypothetical protein